MSPVIRCVLIGPGETFAYVNDSEIHDISPVGKLKRKHWFEIFGGKWIPQTPTQNHTHQSLEGQTNILFSFSSLEDEPLSLPLSQACLQICQGLLQPYVMVKRQTYSPQHNGQYRITQSNSFLHLAIPQRIGLICFQNDIKLSFNQVKKELYLLKIRLDLCTTYNQYTTGIRNISRGLYRQTIKYFSSFLPEKRGCRLEGRRSLVCSFLAHQDQSRKVCVSQIKGGTAFCQECSVKQRQHVHIYSLGTKEPLFTYKANVCIKNCKLFWVVGAWRINQSFTGACCMFYCFKSLLRTPDLVVYQMMRYSQSYLVSPSPPQLLPLGGWVYLSPQLYRNETFVQGISIPNQWVLLGWPDLITEQTVLGASPRNPIFPLIFHMSSFRTILVIFMPTPHVYYFLIVLIVATIVWEDEKISPVPCQRGLSSLIISNPTPLNLIDCLSPQKEDQNLFDFLILPITESSPPFLPSSILKFWDESHKKRMRKMKEDRDVGDFQGGWLTGCGSRLEWRNNVGEPIYNRASCGMKMSKRMKSINLKKKRGVNPHQLVDIQLLEIYTIVVPLSVKHNKNHIDNNNNDHRERIDLFQVLCYDSL
ncbi:hypothetical protein VP01_3651g1 [Puccinia sorghi]|uniref:Uncharacterized protein n=1 Tax=Puccinia sorghi TaxID=27349 RepID=A0A0L6UUI2_9BASI|nr:hypothetical protein VP01_3651g1 [Puccinia sorghi]